MKMKTKSSPDSFLFPGLNLNTWQVLQRRTRILSRSLRADILDYSSSLWAKNFHFLKEVDSFSVFVQTEWHNDNLQLSECKGPFGIHIHVQILKA